MVWIFTSEYDKIGLITVGGRSMPINPYKPGAGSMPSYLAGRTSVMKDAQNIIDTLLNNECPRFIVYYGLRGVGKTVLLNCIQDKAEKNGIITNYFECVESNNFSENLIRTMQLIINSLSVEDYLKDKFVDFKNLFSAFMLKWSSNTVTNENTVSLEFNPNAVFTNKTISLVDLMLELGKIAKARNKSICIMIDEMQYMSKEDLGALMEALHRVAQKDLPIGLFGAGLPKILKLAGEIKSYSERLFNYVRIDTLKYDEAKEALVQPAQRLGVFYKDDAIEEILNITECYPYFIQEYGSQVWFKQNTNKEITQLAVKESYKPFIDKLDTGFFKARLDRVTPTEKKFMQNMVLCDSLPCNISEVAANMKKSVKSISPIRANLINKGLIYDIEHGVITFTVPQFDEFLKRVYPDLQNKNLK